jgi:hypothetical protein
LLTLNALRALQALDALRAFGTGWTRIAFRAALADRTWRADTGRTHRAGRASGTGRTFGPCGAVKACGAAFREQLRCDRLRVDGTALFDHTYTSIEVGVLCFELFDALVLI